MGTGRLLSSGLALGAGAGGAGMYLRGVSSPPLSVAVGRTPRSFENCTASSYDSRCTGRKVTTSVCVRPGSKKISSGNAIEKYLESGSRYRSRMALSLLLVKTNGFAYSRPGTHLWCG